MLAVVQRGVRAAAPSPSGPRSILMFDRVSCTELHPRPSSFLCRSKLSGASSPATPRPWLCSVIRSPTCTRARPRRSLSASASSPCSSTSTVRCAAPRDPIPPAWRARPPVALASHYAYCCPRVPARLPIGQQTKQSPPCTSLAAATSEHLLSGRSGSLELHIVTRLMPTCEPASLASAASAFFYHDRISCETCLLCVLAAPA